jgi:outer membrane lipoprotein-sorting protein
MIRNSFAFVLACTLAVCAAPAFGDPQAGNTLEEVFARMDQAARTFRGLTADMRQLSYTDVVQKTEVEEGTVAVKRVKPKDTRILIKMTKPETKFYSIGENKFHSYVPKSQEAQEADLGKSKDIVNQVMLLAFGSNSAELNAAYTVKLGGPDAVNGEKAARIELVPKALEILKYFKRCDMWISDKGVTLQEKFFEPGGDYVLVNYTRITPAPNLPESAVKLEIPHGVKITKLK